MSKTIMDKKEKINYILDRLKTIWLKYPDLRLGQILCNITEMYSAHTFETGPYYYSDNDLVSTLKKMEKASMENLLVEERSIIKFCKNSNQEDNITIFSSVPKEYLGACYTKGIELLAIEFPGGYPSKDKKFKELEIDEATVELLVQKKILFYDTEETDIIYYTIDSNIDGVDATNVVYDKKYKTMELSFIPSILFLTNIAKMIDPNITYNILEINTNIDLSKSIKGF